MPSPRDFPLLDRQPPLAWLWALGLGLLSATGFAPLSLWPVALLAMGLWGVLIARTHTLRGAFFYGWLFGLAHFTFGNNWIAAAFTHQSEMPIWLGWIAVPLLSTYLALYPALAALAARALVRTGLGWAFALALAGMWIVTEWLRSWVFTGYAWNPFAMVLLGPFDRPGLAAISPFMGTYALSGLSVLLGVAVVLLLRERRFVPMALVAALLVAAMYWPAPAANDSVLAVTIAQPDIGQDRTSDPRFYESNFQRLAKLSSRPDGLTSNRIVLWPESGMADYLREGYPQRYYDRTTAFGSPAFARKRLGKTVGEDSVLLTGAVDLEIGRDDTGWLRAMGARNAITALSTDGAILGGYAKAHLVPYGEYLPFRSILEPLGLSRLVAGSIDFWPGPGPHTLDLGKFGKVGPQICYEIVFSGQLTDRSDRPDYIYNPSTDGWFGTFGPPQHFAQARMRAIEEGLPVLRATTTGISGVIDAHGVVRAFLPMNVRDRIDMAVPAALPPTLFARTGNALALVYALIFLVAALVAMRRRPR